MRTPPSIDVTCGDCRGIIASYVWRSDLDATARDRLARWLVGAMPEMVASHERHCPGPIEANRHAPVTDRERAAVAELQRVIALCGRTLDSPIWPCAKRGAPMASMASDLKRCGDRCLGAALQVCARPSGHRGSHASVDGTTWSDDGRIER